MREGIEEITVKEYAQKRSGGWEHCLIDVREAGEVAICSLEGALHIPMGQVPERIAEIPEKLPIVVVCHHGARSFQVGSYIRNFREQEIINLKGGIHQWALEVDTTMKTY